MKADVVYWDTSWCDKLLDRVLVDCIADNGYSTSHWYTLKNCRCLYDRAGWFAGMRERSGRPYPDRLQRAIIERGCPTMRICRNQIALAIRREDWVSINHRLTAMLEGYFDVLFALNRALHPGEKRLLELAPKLCAKCPPDMQAQVERVIRSAAAPDETMLADIDKLIKGIEVLLPA